MVDSGHFLIFCFLVELAMFFGVGLLFSLAVEELGGGREYDTSNADAGAAALLMFVIFSVVALVFLFKGEL